MKKVSFEKRRKDVESLFKVYFVLHLGAILVEVLLKVLYETGHASVDTFDIKEFLILVGCAVFMFINIRLAKKGHIAAGIIGLIVGVFEIMYGSILGLILGVLVTVCSVAYLLAYNKK